MYSVYVDDLSDYLVKSQIGCHIDNVCVNHVMYADDICLMAPSPAALQKLINIYCVEVWGNACDTHLDTITKIQKKCVRVITFSHYLEPTESLFKDLKILAFKKLVIQRILLLMFKHNIGIVPKPIASLFTKKK